MTPGTGRALAVLDAGFVLEMLDRFFGGPGVAPGAIPNEFSATAEMMAARVVRQLAAPLTIAWEPLVRLGFEAGNVEVNPRCSPISTPTTRWSSPASASPRATASIRSEEHTSELQSLMRISYAVFCLKKKNSI